MTTRHSAAALVFGVAVLVAVCLAPALGTTSRGYQAVAQSEFSPLGRGMSAADDPSSGHVVGSTPTPGHTTSQTPKSGPSATPSPRPTRAPRTYFGPSVAGIATYYQWHRGQAAAAKALRAFLGVSWRGMAVRVCASDQQVRKCLSVVLTDYESSTIPGRLIDLDASDFAAICGPLSKGVCDVVVTHG